jgi:hypothetical protein
MYSSSQRRRSRNGLRKISDPWGDVREEGESEEAGIVEHPGNDVAGHSGFRFELEAVKSQSVTVRENAESVDDVRL